MDEEEREAGGVVEGEGWSDPFWKVEESGCCYADCEGGELVEDGPDDDWDVAEGLGWLSVRDVLVVIIWQGLMGMTVANWDPIGEYTYSIRMQLTSHIDN